MKRPWQWIHIAFVALLIALGFFGLARVWAGTMRADHSTKDFWDVATAIGTCGAAIVAIWIALRQESLRRAEELDRARLISAHLAPRLSAMLAAGQRSLDVIAKPRQDSPDYEKIRALTNELEKLAWKVPQDELTGLTPLPRSTAVRLARAIALLNTIAEDIRVNESKFRAGVVALAMNRVRDDLYGSWTRQLKEGTALLNDVLDELNAVAGKLFVAAS